MELKDLTAFLMNHTGEKWFDSDFELYKKVFPNSKLIPALENAQNYNKAHLDERMCNELITSGAICDCSIWENRGFTKDKDGFIVPMQKAVIPCEFEKQLMELDLDEKPDYNTMKAIIFGLGLHTENNKYKTYVSALKVKKDEIEKSAKGSKVDSGASSDNDTTGQKDQSVDGLTGQNDQSTENTDSAEQSAKEDAEKKSQDQDQNIQQ